MRESGESIEARAVAAKKLYGKPYRKPMIQIQALAKATKDAGREPTGYGVLCDDIFCGLCRKGKGEKAPWNREPS